MFVIQSLLELDQIQRNLESNVYILIKTSTWGCADQTWFNFIGLNNDCSIERNKYYMGISKEKNNLKEVVHF